MTLGRDAQPDILCGGDPLWRGYHRWRARAAWLTGNIAIELSAIGNPARPAARKAAARRWIVLAQAERRRALGEARACRILMAGRDKGRGLATMSALESAVRAGCSGAWRV